MKMINRKLLVKLFIINLVILFIPFASFSSEVSQSKIKSGQFNWNNSFKNIFFDEAIPVKDSNDIIFINNFELSPIVSLSTSQEIIQSGGSVTLSWVIANDAISCTKSGAWTGLLTGTDVSNGKHNEVISNITITSTFLMECVNSFGSSGAQAIQIIVKPMNECIDQPPILAGNRDNNPNNYTQLGVGASWPGPPGTTLGFTITRDHYVAIEFTTDSEILSSQLFFVEPSIQIGPISTATTVAISQCPGDFTTHLNQARCLINGGSNFNIYWSTNPAQNTNVFCILEANTQYYLNLVHSVSPIGIYNSSGCQSAECGVLASQNY